MNMSNPGIDSELVKVITGIMEEKVEELSKDANNYEMLLVMKNLTSQLENKIAVEMQGASSYAVLHKIMNG